MTKDQLKELRGQLKLTQEDLAQGLGISIRTVEGWESKGISIGFQLLLEHLGWCRKFQQLVKRQARKPKIRREAKS